MVAFQPRAVEVLTPQRSLIRATISRCASGGPVSVIAGAHRTGRRPVLIGLAVIAAWPGGGPADPVIAPGTAAWPIWEGIRSRRARTPPGGSTEVSGDLSAELAPQGIRVVGLRPHGMPETATMKDAYEWRG
jgi:hypothetical protein